MTQLTLALKEILKHRRIKSNSEIKLFSEIVDDLFKCVVFQYPTATYTKSDYPPPSDKTLQEELNDTKDFLKVWLKLMISDKALSSIDLDDLSKFSLEVSYSIIYNIVDSFKFEYVENAETELLEVNISNSVLPDCINKISIAGDLHRHKKEDLKNIITKFINHSKSCFNEN